MPRKVAIFSMTWRSQPLLPWTIPKIRTPLPSRPSFSPRSMAKKMKRYRTTGKPCENLQHTGGYHLSEPFLGAMSGTPVSALAPACCLLLLLLCGHDILGYVLEYVREILRQDTTARQCIPYWKPPFQTMMRIYDLRDRSGHPLSPLSFHRLSADWQWFRGVIGFSSTNKPQSDQYVIKLTPSL